MRLTGWRAVGRSVVEGALRDDVSGLAAELAYRLFLALFPFLMFLGALGGFLASFLGVQNPAQVLVGLLGESLPPGAGDAVRSELRAVVGERNPGVLSAGFLGALLLATAGTNAAVKALNRAYGVRETRSLPRRYLLALGLTLATGILAVLAFLLFVVADLAGPAILAAAGFDGSAGFAFRLLRWPLALLSLWAGASLLYWLGPNLALGWRWRDPGPVAFAAGWALITYLFGVYLAHAGRYGAFYGALSGVAVLLVWFYLVSLVLVLGAELSAAVSDRREGARLDRARRRAEDEAEERLRTLARDPAAPLKEGRDRLLRR